MLSAIYTRSMDEVTNWEHVHCGLAARSEIVMDYSGDSLLSYKHYFSVAEMFEIFYRTHSEVA